MVLGALEDGVEACQRIRRYRHHRGEEPVLRSEELHHQRRVDSGVARYLPDRRRSKTVVGETGPGRIQDGLPCPTRARPTTAARAGRWRSEEHTSELQSRGHLLCRLLLEKKNQYNTEYY